MIILVWSLKKLSVNVNHYVAFIVVINLADLETAVQAGSWASVQILVPVLLSQNQE